MREPPLWPVPGKPVRAEGGGVRTDMSRMHRDSAHTAEDRDVELSGEEATRHQAMLARCNFLGRDMRTYSMPPRKPRGGWRGCAKLSKIWLLG